MRASMLNVLLFFAIASAKQTSQFGETRAVVENLARLCGKLRLSDNGDFNDDWGEVFGKLKTDVCKPLKAEIGSQMPSGDCDPQKEMSNVCDGIDDLGLERPEGLSENIYDILLDVGEICEDSFELMVEDAAENEDLELVEDDWDEDDNDKRWGDDDDDDIDGNGDGY